MKSLRILVLMLAVGALPPLLMGQQEVDPDHFDQPAASKANANPLKAQTNHGATAAGHQASKHAKTASKRTGGKPNHRQAQA